MFGRLSNKMCSLAAYGLAGGVVFVESASGVLSMAGDLVLVALLLLALMLGKPKDKP